ncbi:conserved membrane hypothetical protein [Candidatus Desulfarcum epimagneticum]|uniref:Inner membrane protein YqiJ n=1 Tax=uncultured Desulfobacteraceae bacterium TaxID=218296 RepID=A0A484HJJ5_9BACT|nr:conserved membrane hypothetical protein [uncultured Desulfobacteraceae bacterium]
MIEFILMEQNLPFAVSIALMLLIAFLEGAMTAIGAGLSELIDSFMPGSGPDLDVDIDLDQPEFSVHGALTKTMGWLHIGKTPFLIILVVFLTTFGLMGFGFQSVILKIAGRPLPALPASIIVFILALPVFRTFAGIVAKIMPKDETQAVEEKSFIGRVAVITLGKASPGKPAQAKLKDQFGTWHYVMIEPDIENEEFQQGEKTLIVRRKNSGFKAIRNKISALD